ncbi:hypothetical protein [Acetobacter fallax]|nr:hypothetical protein [Acetobacter fallax]
MNGYLSGIIICVITFPAFITSSHADSTGIRPSPVEQQIIDQHLAAMKNPDERRATRDQGAAWLMTTFLCQDAARKTLVKLGSSPYRFFLQDERLDSQHVVSPALVEGRGQFLHAGTATIRWTSFSWACHLDPATGHVLGFVARPGPDVVPGP